MEVVLPIKRLEHSGGVRPATGIVHLGLGAFFRAFGCVYISDAMIASGGGWGIIGVSLRRSDIRDALQQQDWAYTSMSLDTDVPNLRVIEVLNNVLFAPENPQLVVDAMADPSVKIVTLTVTEKGYCHIPASGTLNLEHPDIHHDLSNELPASAVGYIVRALQARRVNGLAPFTVLTCDNLPNNGQLVRNLVLEFACLLDSELADWIKVNGCFPCTMVDRITPATTSMEIAYLEKLSGYHDAAPVLHERFSQWAIEDNFVDGQRPDFAAAGAELVINVKAHEDMKLRMLNGVHSALAYTGYLAGHMTISETLDDPIFEAFARGLWCEIIPTVHAPVGVNLTDYGHDLLVRFANPSIRHLTWQIAMDGSQKLPQRMLCTLRDTIVAGRPAPMLCLAVAAWMRYVGGRDENGEVIDVKDPMSKTLFDLSAASQSPAETVAAILNLREIFPADLSLALLQPVSQAAEMIWTHGSRAAVLRAVNTLQKVVS